ncbi:hypothetical protein KY330_01795 [Candidatus Woesearchaeota archaeon]|nr:hypothetical protein [Candidatus Woesearchaeota archaeon]
MVTNGLNGLVDEKTNKLKEYFESKDERIELSEYLVGEFLTEKNYSNPGSVPEQIMGSDYAQFIEGHMLNPEIRQSMDSGITLEDAIKLSKLSPKARREFKQLVPSSAGSSPSVVRVDSEKENRKFESDYGNAQSDSERLNVIFETLMHGKRENQESTRWVYKALSRIAEYAARLGFSQMQVYSEINTVQAEVYKMRQEGGLTPEQQARIAGLLPDLTDVRPWYKKPKFLAKLVGGVALIGLLGWGGKKGLESVNHKIKYTQRVVTMKSWVDNYVDNYEGDLTKLDKKNLFAQFVKYSGSGSDTGVMRENFNNHYGSKLANWVKQKQRDKQIKEQSRRTGIEVAVRKGKEELAKPENRGRFEDIVDIVLQEASLAKGPIPKLRIDSKSNYLKKSLDGLYSRMNFNSNEVRTGIENKAIELAEDYATTEALGIVEKMFSDENISKRSVQWAYNRLIASEDLSESSEISLLSYLLAGAKKGNRRDLLKNYIADVRLSGRGYVVHVRRTKPLLQFARKKISEIRAEEQKERDRLVNESLARQ